MAYANITFPTRIAFGAQRRGGWKTSIARSTSGRESANQEWSRTRYSFDVSFSVRTSADYEAIVDHFHSVRGRFKHFPFTDVLDYRVDTTNGVLIDEGSSGYQLAKRYGAAPDNYDRIITRPRDVAVFRTRTAVTTDITADCTIDTTTGLVDPDPGIVIGGDTLAWSGEFDIPCRYDTDELPALIVNRMPGQDDFDNLLVQCDGIVIVEVIE